MSKQTQNRIRELRKKAKLSQQALADQIGVFRNTISNWETGYSQISLENAKNVAEILKQQMENVAPELSVKLKVEVSIGKDWLNM